jgi:methyltransferase (TIGR00027 family)
MAGCERGLRVFFGGAPPLASLPSRAMPRLERPSYTAAKVGRVFVFLGQHERYAALLPKGAAELTDKLLRETGGLGPRMQRAFESPLYRASIEQLGDRLGPGQMVRVGLRKRFMDDEIRAALAAGVTQVLVVGAGFDTTCMRLAAEFEDRLFVEIDHPSTHASKRAGIEALGATRDNLRLLEADLATTTLAAALDQLEQPSWDRTAQTIVIAEGVFMYLQRADVERFFAAVRELTGPGSRVAFTYMKGDARGRVYLNKHLSGVARWWLKTVGEPILWCVANERELGTLVERVGWRYEPAPERFDLGARYLAPAGLDDRERADPIEFMAVVDRAP